MTPTAQAEPEVAPRRRAQRSVLVALLATVLVALGLSPVASAAGAQPVAPAAAVSRADSGLADTNVALTAGTDASYTAPWNSLAAINDGKTPTSGLNQMWGNYSGDRPRENWISYHWDNPVALTRSVITFWTDAGAAGTGDHVWTPQSWKLQYKSMQQAEWTDVPGGDAYGTADATANTTDFPKITVTDLRALMIADSNSAGSLYSALSVTEWEVWGAEDSGPPPSSTDPLAADELHLPTLVGTVPTLPASVWFTYTDGIRNQLPVSWPTVTAAQVAAPGNFTVSGTATGVSTAVSATVYVRAAGTEPALTGFLPMSAITVTGTAPQLPTTALAEYADDSVDSRIPVTWQTPAPAQYAATGLFTLTGTVAGTALQPEIVVFVDDPADASARPVVRLELDPEQPSTGYYTGPVTLLVTASSDTDPNPAIEYRVDQGDWLPYVTGSQVDGDGEHTVTVRATDADDRVSAERSATFEIDATAPVSAADTTDRADRVELTLTSTDSGSGVATIQYQVGDGFIASYAGSPVGVPKLTVPQTVRYFATDHAGNVETARAFQVPALVTIRPTSSAITLTPRSVVTGKSARVAVAVTAATGARPTGKVTLKDGSTTIGSATMVNGVAAFSTPTTLLPGTHRLTASYAGSATTAPSTVSATLTVTTAVSTTTVAVPQTGYGTRATATVKVKGANGIAATGTVTVLVDGRGIGTAKLVNGAAKVTLPVGKAGRHVVTAKYSGNTRLAASVGKVTQVVAKSKSATTAKVTPTSITAGQRAKVAVTVVVTPRAVTATGTVKVTVGSGSKAKVVRVALRGGKATLTLPKLPAGTHRLVAAYSGSANIAGSSTVKSIKVVR